MNGSPLDRRKIKKVTKRRSKKEFYSLASYVWSLLDLLFFLSHNEMSKCFLQMDRQTLKEADKLLEDPGYNSGIRMESKRKEDKVIFLITHRFRMCLMRQEGK